MLPHATVMPNVLPALVLIHCCLDTSYLQLCLTIRAMLLGMGTYALMSLLTSERQVISFGGCALAADVGRAGPIVSACAAPAAVWPSPLAAATAHVGVFPGEPICLPLLLVGLQMMWNQCQWTCSMQLLHVSCVIRILYFLLLCSNACCCGNLCKC